MTQPNSNFPSKRHTFTRAQCALAGSRSPYPLGARSAGIHYGAYVDDGHKARNGGSHARDNW